MNQKQEQLSNEELVQIGFENYLQNLKENSLSAVDKGTLFEKSCIKILKTASFFVNDIKKVWKWKDFPGNGGSHDVGIDLVALDVNNSFWAIQCKFYDNELQISKEGIDSFIAASGMSFVYEGKKCNYSTIMIMSTTDKMTENSQKMCSCHNPSVILFGPDRLRSCGVDWSTFSIKDIEGMKAIDKKTLRPDQKDAVDDVINGFKNHDRGKLIMACGTGKTFTSLKIIEKYITNLRKTNCTVLYLVPSIALLSQTILEWKSQFSLEDGNDMFAICSDVTTAKVSRKEEQDNGELTNIPIPATTNSKWLIDKFNEYRSDNKVHFFFSTYQSIDVVHKVEKEGGFVFDMIICDEAHRTIGAYLSSSENVEDRSDFTKVHDNDYLPAKKRLYMTATEKIFGQNAKNKATDAGYTMFSMDDENIYGPRLHTLSFSEAVEKDLLSDYRLIVLNIKESQVTELFTPGQFGDLSQAARIFGTITALSKKPLYSGSDDFSSDPLPMKRAVVFCSRIKESEEISTIFNELPDKRYLGKEYFDDNKLIIPDTQSISGFDNSSEKNEKLDWLRDMPKEKTCRMLINARCLSEGVDVPSLDAVVFMAKKRSQVDIIQAVGRVMRKGGTASQKKYGYIILPVVINDENITDNTLTNNDDYKVVWQVVQALRSHDDRLDRGINKYEYTKEIPPNIIISDTFVPPKNKSCVNGARDGIEGIGDTDNIVDPIHVQMAMKIPSADEIKKNTDTFGAHLVKKCGNRLYWDDWSKEIGVVTNQCATMIEKLVKSNENCKNEFEKFVKGIRGILNPYITDNNAIAMLAEHMVTLPVFNALFNNKEFVEKNVVSQIMTSMLNKLYDAGMGRESEKLQDFYESVKDSMEGITDSVSKQNLVKKLYEKFFQYALPEQQEKFGIVYTPNEIVDFIINSVDDILKDKFGERLINPNVKILDPFTGTGTFIVRLIDKLKEDGATANELKKKYINDIWCNEIMLLAYYIAVINIEDSFSVYNDGYIPFEHAILTDTFEMAERRKKQYQANGFEDEAFELVNDKAKEEDYADIRVIIANPPYSVGQRNANDNNANNKYETLDNEISDTYLKNVNVTNTNSVYDSYVRSFRWASDRVNENGIVAYVSNGSYIDNMAFSGFRESLLEEFQHVFVLNLRGNCRTSGELRKKEKDNVFGEGSRTTICITLLVKHKGIKNDGYVHYFDIGDYLTREDKLNKLKTLKSEKNVNWNIIKPDAHNDWLNKKDDSFSRFMSIGNKKGNDSSIFSGCYSSGIKTGKDAWLYSYDICSLKEKVANYISFYEEQLKMCLPFINGPVKGRSNIIKSKISWDPKKIKWNDEMIDGFVCGKHLNNQHIEYLNCFYRPFVKSNLCYCKALIQRTYCWQNIIPSNEYKNIVIAIPGLGNKKEFSALIADRITDLGFMSATQVFPLYWYEHNSKHDLFEYSEKESAHHKQYAISDKSLSSFRQAYSDQSITKEDIFYYIYGLFHSTTYKKKYANNLSKEFPRIPFLKDFFGYSLAGKKLAKIHLNYDKVNPYSDVKIIVTKDDYTIKKIKFASKEDKTRIIFNEYIQIENIPIKVYKYVVNGRSPIEWVLDQYQYSVDGDSGIINDPNLYDREQGGKYVFNLILSLITVSLETLELIKTLPEYKELS